MDIKSRIRTIPNHPKQGVLFHDITTLLLDPEATDHCIEQIIKHFEGKKIDKIVGVESRGFIFGALVANKFNLPFVIVRKCGKLPAETERIEYETEYSTDCIEIHKDAIDEGDNILIVDDLIATGGTAAAQAKLIEKLGAKIVGFAFIVELSDLKPRKKLKGYNVFSIVKSEGG